MDRLESRALENLLTAQQILECIDEQRDRAVRLNMLSSLSAIAIEKGYLSQEQLEAEMEELQQTASQVDMGGMRADEEADREELLSEVRADKSDPLLADESNDFLDVLAEPQQPEAKHAATPAEKQEHEESSLESTMQKRVLAELAYPGDSESQIFEVALTEVDGQSLVGKTLLGYQLTTLIGEGPISDVFKVIKAGSEHALSLKLLPKRIFKTPLHIRRFLTRTRRAAKLSHPNIIQPLDSGETPHHLCYVLTDYVEAVPLWLLIKRHEQISEKMSLAILRFIARGLQYAHGKGFVHGNLKPANVLVTPRGVVRITDWGTPRTCMLLAWDKLNQDVGRLRLISEGMAYLAPEIVMGETEVDISCDVYAMGAMLYHMLTGKLPFRGEREEVLRSITQGLPELPPDLASEGSRELIRRLCAKEPADRYERVDKAVVAVETVLKNLKA